MIEFKVAASSAARSAASSPKDSSNDSLNSSEDKSIIVDCYRSLNLLAHAQIEELEIGSRCGGYGECGGDRILIQEGADCLSPPTDAEREHLTESALKQGWRLGCQCYPEQDGADIRVKVPFEA